MTTRVYYITRAIRRQTSRDANADGMPKSECRSNEQLRDDIGSEGKL